MNPFGFVPLILVFPILGLLINLAFGRRLVVEFPVTRESFEYFLPPETTSFRPPYPDDLYRPLDVCEHGGVLRFESFIITAQGELPGGDGAANLGCPAQP